MNGETSQKYETTSCPSCRTTFGCGANAGDCWCSAIEVSGGALAELQKDYENCLCGNCLERFAGT